MRFSALCLLTCLALWASHGAALGATEPELVVEGRVVTIRPDKVEIAVDQRTVWVPRSTIPGYEPVRPGSQVTAFVPSELLVPAPDKADGDARSGR